MFVLLKILTGPTIHLADQTPNLGVHSALIPFLLPPFLKSNGQLDLQIILNLFNHSFTSAMSSKTSSATWTSTTVPHQPLSFHGGLPTLHSAHMARWSVDKTRSGHSPAYNLPTATQYKEDKP